MGLGSEIRYPEKTLFRIPDPGSKMLRIRIRNTVFLSFELEEWNLLPEGPRINVKHVLTKSLNLPVLYFRLDLELTRLMKIAYCTVLGIRWASRTRIH